MYPQRRMPFVKAIYEWKGRAALVDSYYRFSGLSVTFGELGIRFKLTMYWNSEGIEYRGLGIRVCGLLIRFSGLNKRSSGQKLLHFANKLLMDKQLPIYSFVYSTLISKERKCRVKLLSLIVLLQFFLFMYLLLQ